MIRVGGQDALKTVRRAHEAVVLDTVIRCGVTARTDLVEQTGLSRTTLLAVVSDLITDGALLESKDDTDQPRRGRPTQLLRINPRGGLWLAVEVAPARIRVGFANAAHEVIAHAERSVPLDASRAARVRVVDQLIEHTATTEKVSVGALRGIAVAGVGVAPSGRLVPGPGVADPNAAAVQRHLAKRLGAPTLLNDSTRLAAFAESAWGVAKGCDNVLYVRLSHSVAAGVIVNGQVVSGATGRSGAIGHVVVDPRGEPCRCGQRGCLETVLGVAGLIQACRAAGRSVTTVGELTGLLRAGDSVAGSIVRRAAALLVPVIVPVLAALNPEALVLGGVMSREEHDVVEPIRAGLDAYLLPGVGRATRLLVSPGSEGYEAVHGGLALLLLSKDGDPTSLQGRIRRSHDPHDVGVLTDGRTAPRAARSS